MTADTSANPSDSNSASTSSVSYPGVSRLNDAVYEVYRPRGAARAQIVFVHGIEQREYARAYYETWLTRDGSQCWPKDLLPDSFETAAIYLVSYDSSATEDSTHGRFDMFTVAESLLANLINADIGQSHRCPVILVGHDLGGLVIKEVCCQANDSLPHQPQRETFVNQVKGVFYFSTPHGGVYVNDELNDESELMAALRVHCKITARLNERFRELRNIYKWKAYGVRSAHGIKQGQVKYSVEASERRDVDNFVTISVSSDEICKPVDKQSSSFQCLERFISEVLSCCAAARPKLRFGADPVYVPLDYTAQKVRESFRYCTTVVLSGEAGSGKTSLAKHLALEYMKQPMHEANFWDGVYFVECGRAADVLTVQRNLLRQLGVEKRLGEQPSESIGRDPSTNHQMLHEHLQHLEALVILDDVCDHSLVEKLMVHGANLRYLLTAQESNIWTDGNAMVCRIEDVQLKCGMQIIAKRVGFPDGIPTDLEAVVTDLVMTVSCHPLALATLAMTVHPERKAKREEWIDAKCNLDTYLDQNQERKRPVGFGHKYHTGVYASMMCAMKLLYKESREAFEILCFIALFEGPSVPVRLIHHFAKWSHPKYRNSAYMWIKDLESRTLLQLQNIHADRSGDISVSMHGLRQRFILATEEEHVKAIRDRVWDFKLTCKTKSESNMATALCALYGVEETREKAERCLGRKMKDLPLMTLQDSRDFLFEMMQLMDGVHTSEYGTQEREIVTQAAEEVLWSYMFKSHLDEKSITCLQAQQLVAGRLVACLAERREVGFKFFEAVDLPNKRTFGFGDMNICAQVQLWKGKNRVCFSQTVKRKGGSYCDLEGQVVAFNCFNSSFGSDLTAKVLIFHKSDWTDESVEIGNFLIEVPEVSKPPAFYRLLASGAQTRGRVKMSVVVEEPGSVLVPVAMQNPRAKPGFVTKVAVAVMTEVISESIKHIFRV